MSPEFTRLAIQLNRARERQAAAHDAIAAAELELNGANKAVREAEAAFFDHATALAQAVGTGEPA